MGGDAELRAPVHLMGADLDLHGFAAGADDRGVEALVHVVLRHRDVVLEPAGDRVPPGVDDAEGRVAFADGFDEDADADEVVDVGELVTAHDHLLVDRVVVLRPAGDGRLDAGVGEFGLELMGDGREVLLPLRCPVGDEADHLVVDLGVEDLEREILEFPLDRVHAEPVRERGVDLEGLACLLRARRGGHELPRARVVETVGELDDEDADVLGHRDDHLPHGLRLRGLTVGELVELRHPVDHRGDLGAEGLGELLE